MGCSIPPSRTVKSAAVSPWTRLSIPIEHRDVDLDDVRGGAEDGHLLRAAGRRSTDREDGDEDGCVGSSHRLSRDSAWILSLQSARLDTLDDPIEVGGVQV